jgi:putative membrane-bound dehydrogenase-like protein
MRRLSTVAVALFALTTAHAAEPTPPTHQVRLNGHTFTLPAGFDIELVAGPPLVNRPIEADFDELGRLYVSDSSGSNERVQVQLEKKPHRVVRLVDTKGTGKFDQQTVFADKMMFPEGVMYFAGSVYVAAAPSIWKLTDTKGDGVADQREEWFKGKTLTGCANDLHGPYLGPDGWIYWCKGAFAEQTYDRAGKPPFKTRAAHIFRCRPDGTGIEPIMTGGMDNPVEVAFTSSGETFFTTTFIQHPGGGKRDAIAHAIYGGVYGKDHDVIYDHPWTGPTLMPVMTHLGAAAPCGLACYQSEVFGKDYRDNLFACLFNMHKVTRHILLPDGATWKTKDSDFLVSDNLDFHPTDVLEDADGSLLVIDTGGWYKICCPTSQLPKPDVLGAIYRIRRAAAPKIDDPRGLKLDWKTLTPDELARLLGDRRPAVRKRAVETLSAKGEQVIPALRTVLKSSEKSVETRCNAVWTATRIEGQAARRFVQFAMDDNDETVALAALHSASLWRDFGRMLAEKDRVTLPNPVTGSTQYLGQKGMHIDRVLVEAAGRSANRESAATVVSKLAGSKDRVIQHACIFALIEMGDSSQISKLFGSDNPHVRCAGLIALDQMANGHLDPAAVIKELNSAEPALRETAWWIAGRHPEWGEKIAGFLTERFEASNGTKTEREQLVPQLARFAGTASIQKFLADRLADEKSPADVRRLVLRGMAGANLKHTPGTWIDAVGKLLARPGALTAEAVTTAKALRVAKEHAKPLADKLVAIAGDAKLPDDVRLNALSAVPGGLPSVDSAEFTLLLTHLGPEQAVAVRSTAADVLSRAKLTNGQLDLLAAALKRVGPLELDRLLDAFSGCKDEKVGKSLVAALSASAARSSLRVDALQKRLASFGPAVQKDAEGLYALLRTDAARQTAYLEKLAATISSGDIRRGQLVFNSSKAACSSCHAIGYLGGNIGPDLTHIGQIRSERDLLESIVFPSLSFVRSYEPMVVTTKNGKVYNGLVKRDTPEEIMMVLGANQEVHIPKSDIDDMQPSKVSIMPAGLDQQLGPRDLADLVAFLKACK